MGVFSGGLGAGWGLGFRGSGSGLESVGSGRARCGSFVLVFACFLAYTGRLALVGLAAAARRFGFGGRVGGRVVGWAGGYMAIANVEGGLLLACLSFVNPVVKLTPRSLGLGGHWVGIGWEWVGGVGVWAGRG